MVSNRVSLTASWDLSAISSSAFADAREKAVKALVAAGPAQDVRAPLCKPDGARIAEASGASRVHRFETLQRTWNERHVCRVSTR